MAWVFGTVLITLVVAGTAVGGTSTVSASEDVTYPRINQLEERFLEPEGFQWGNFTNGDRAKIRYGWIEPRGEIQAVAVLLPGRTAPIEKYFEPIRDLLSRGFAVWSMDWRGQAKEGERQPGISQMIAQKRRHEGRSI